MKLLIYSHFFAPSIGGDAPLGYRLMGLLADYLSALAAQILSAAK
jgi:hypothetical protein